MDHRTGQDRVCTLALPCARSLTLIFLLIQCPIKTFAEKNNHTWGPQAHVHASHSIFTSGHVPWVGHGLQEAKPRANLTGDVAEPGLSRLTAGDMPLLLVPSGLSLPCVPRPPGYALPAMDQLFTGANNSEELEMPPLPLAGPMGPHVHPVKGPGKAVFVPGLWPHCHQLPRAGHSRKSGSSEGSEAHQGGRGHSRGHLDRGKNEQQRLEDRDTGVNL